MRKLSLLVFGALLLAVASIAGAQGGYPDPGTAETNAIIQNLATGNGEVATLAISYYSETGGNPVYTNSSVTINPKSVVEVKTANEPLPAGFSGAAIISSDRPVAAVTSIRYTNVPGAADGTTQGAYNGASAGSSTLYFPSFWAFQFIVSRITVQNTEDAVANIALDFYKRDGTFLGTLNDSLQPYGSKTYCGCDPSDWPNGNIPASWSGDGSVTVRSTNGKLLAGASVATRGGSASAYQALTDSDKGTVLYAPSSFRFNNNVAVTQNGPMILLSAVNIQNTDPNNSVQIKIEYFSRDTGSLDLTIPYTIPAGSAVGANNQNGGSLDWNLFKALKNTVDGDWDGSVKITSLNPSIKLVGTGVTQFKNADKTTMYALIPEQAGTSALFLPAQYRLDYGTGSFKQWSSLNLQNVGTSSIAANQLVIQYINTNGATVKTLTGGSLPVSSLGAGAALGANTRNGGDLAASAFNDLGMNFVGGIYVYSTDPNAKLVATANIDYPNRASSYNAVPAP